MSNTSPSLFLPPSLYYGMTVPILLWLMHKGNDGMTLCAFHGGSKKGKSFHIIHDTLARLARDKDVFSSS